MTGAGQQDPPPTRARAGEAGRAGALVLVGGHESAFGRALEPPPSPPGLPVVVARSGRTLEQALDRALEAAGPDLPVVVLPMTVGRDPRLISDAARTVRWAARGEQAGRIALAPSLGTPDHLIGWLRAACLRLPDADAVVLAAPAADPFDDAELYRVAALVRVNAPERLVEVGLRGPDGGLEQARERCRLLGAQRVAVVAAELGTPLDADAALLSQPALRQIVAARVATACHRLDERGDDGVAAAHAADHAHGFAHSHGEEEHGQAHVHGHPHPHAHDHHVHDRVSVG